MESRITVAVVEPTTAVGAELVAVLLEERARLGIEKLRLLGTGEAVGEELESDDFTSEVEELGEGSLEGVDAVFFAEDPALARRFAPMARSALVLDATGAFRADPAALLVSPWVNDEVLDDIESARGRIVAGPSAAAAQLSAVLLPIAARAGLMEVRAVSLEAASGAGLAGVEELSQETVALLNAREPEPSRLPQRLAFNVLAHAGSTGAIEAEVRRLLDRPLPALLVESVTVPVFFAHTQLVTARTEKPLSPEEAREALRDLRFVKVLDEPATGVFPSPALAVGDDSLLVGLLRETPFGLSLVSAADNIRFGVALPLVQILAHLREADAL